MVYSSEKDLYLQKLTDKDVFPQYVGQHTAMEEHNISQKIDDKHHSRITDVVFSPDGSLIISSDSDGYINIWSTEKRKLIENIKNHSDAITCIKFSPSGSFFASTGYDEHIILYKAPTTTPERVQPALKVKVFHKKHKTNNPHIHILPNKFTLLHFL